MANATNGTVWNLPNYTGELFTASTTEAPLLSMIGGMTGGLLTSNFEFPTAQLYEHDDVTQESITENASLTAPTATSFVRSQEKNVVQIFHEAINLSYARLSGQGRLSGINTAGTGNPVPSEKDWQIARHMEAMARKIEWHFINGTYNIATTADEANQTRGLLELCASGSTVPGVGAALSDELLKSLWLEMFNNGAPFRNILILAGGYQKIKLSEAYGYQPESRNVGGVNITTLITDFGTMYVAPAHKFIPADTILAVDLSVLAPVFEPVPDKGVLFYEELAKIGASERGQLYTQVGLDHGPVFAHGTITGLKTSDN